MNGSQPTSHSHSTQVPHQISRILPVSDTALLIEYPDLDAVLAHFTALSEAELAGVTELIPAAATIMVRFDPALIDPLALAGHLRAIPAVTRAGTEYEPITIDVVYNGQDLAEVAELLNMTVEELVNRHSSVTWRGAFGGFAPGFVYCVSDDPVFNVPRRSSPRTRIPAGSVGLAGTFSAVYPRESPGGWQLLGQTPQRMWDLDRTPPALIQPGQQVRYRPVREAAVDLTGAAPQEITLPTVAADAPAIEIVRPGAQLLLQDAGRPGMLAIGVGASGAADRRAFHAANRAVGNDPHTAVLEIAGGAAELRIRARGVVAFTGASGTRAIIDSEGRQYPFDRDQPTSVEPGDTVRIGGFTRGMRGYLAVRGGFDLDPILGSLTTDTLSGVGPAPLRAGDVLPLRDPAAIARGTGPEGALPVTKITSVETAVSARPELEEHDALVELDIVLGPRTDWFTAEALELLSNHDWTVTPASDRVGLRLTGGTDEAGNPIALTRSTTAELPSEGAATGAIQVPADGQPVLFLPDHPVTGGYPVIGAVTDRDLDRAGQLAPGMRVRFRVVREFTEL